jgi:3',5'-cyclic AMP phosphodiesterase CpdA
LIRILLVVAGILLVAAAPQRVRFAIVGDRTGETVPGIFEQVLRAVAGENPAFAITTGDSIQGQNELTAEAEWKEFRALLAPYRLFPVYLTPGNHDIWSESSEALYRRYSGHPVHYGFDYGPAHFTILDNSRSDEMPPGELAFLEEDLKSHAAQPVKFVLSHRPSWIFPVILRNGDFPLHRLFRQYGVRFVIAGHVHQMLHFELDGVTYLSMPSAGGHLRASGKYEDGWFFGYTMVDVRQNEVRFAIQELGGNVTSPADWGAAGLKGRPPR